MNASSLTEIALAAVGGIAIGAAVTWILSREKYRRMVSALTRTVAKLNQAASSAAEKQAGLLHQLAAMRTELERHKTKAQQSSQVQGSARRVTDFPQVKAMNDLFVSPPAPRPSLGFEDTQIL